MISKDALSTLIIFIPAWLWLGWLSWIVWFSPTWREWHMGFNADMSWDNFQRRMWRSRYMLWVVRILYPVFFVVTGYALFGDLLRK